MQKALYTHLKNLPLCELLQQPKVILEQLAIELKSKGIHLSVEKGNKKNANIRNFIVYRSLPTTKQILQNQTGAKIQPAYH